MGRRPLLEFRSRHAPALRDPQQLNWCAGHTPEDSTAPATRGFR